MTSATRWTPRRRPVLRLALATLLTAAMVTPVGGVAAAAPGAAGEVYPVDEQFQSMLWTEVCGFPVLRQNAGRERIWEEPRGGGGIVFRGVFQLTITLTGMESGRSYTFTDRGTDRERLLADGSTEVAVIGRSFPNNTIGRQVRVDDEVVRHSGRAAYDPAAICALLAP